MTLRARDRLIVALDFPSAAQALALVERLDGQALWYKVGLELYLGAGPSLLHELAGRGFKVFLDLKLHDIPNTVAGAVRSLGTSGAELLTVHASGGFAMLQAAAEAADATPHSPRLLAVTVLTSMNAAELNATGVPCSPLEQVRRLAGLARAAGLTGMVCSPQEVRSLRADEAVDGVSPDEESLLVVPGIRPAGSDAGDQSRLAEPRHALADGASMLVVGRPITQAPDPAVAIASILAEMEQALQQI